MYANPQFDYPYPIVRAPRRSRAPMTLSWLANTGALVLHFAALCFAVNSVEAGMLGWQNPEMEAKRPIWDALTYASMSLAILFTVAALVSLCIAGTSEPNAVRRVNTNELGCGIAFTAINGCATLIVTPIAMLSSL